MTGWAKTYFAKLLAYHPKPSITIAKTGTN
nr:MAG TPA: hypothetical protein [Bacteriophage sp.]